jgi:hypothetical protein
MPLDERFSAVFADARFWTARSFPGIGLCRRQLMV